jgi:pimeloyl-ACP methyl ester carboxylesterase
MDRIETPAGITCSYERSGSGPPLVLVHGTLSNHAFTWMLVKPLLEPKFTLHSVARRGRGETSSTEGHTIVDEAHDIVAVIDSIGEPAFLLGHSYGAHVCLAAAALAPARVRKLVLYEPPAPPGDLRRKMFDRFAELAEQGEHETIVDEFFRNVIEVPGSQVDILRTTPVWPLIVADVPNAVREWPAMINYDWDPERFRSLSMPVLLLTGGDSPQSNYATQTLATVVPDARVVEFPGQGHIAMSLAPQLFAETVTSFLQDGA